MVVLEVRLIIAQVAGALLELPAAWLVGLEPLVRLVGVVLAAAVVAETLQEPAVLVVLVA